MKICTIPPNGWLCSREKGHTGPCAAFTSTVSDKMCIIISDLYINPKEYTACTTIYEVTFEQLRLLYDLGRSHGNT